MLGCQTSVDTSELSDDSVSIAYAEPITDYSPFSYESKDRKYLSNIYDPLVSYDASFNTDTALAVAWGRLDDKTWEFRLREGVVFHDGTAFDSEDVLYSFDVAMNSEESELRDLLSGIVGVTASEDYRVQVQTSEPDPLLLNRLVNLYMVPNGFDDYITPTGTGPYFVSGFEDDTLILQRFNYYWGKLPYYAEARLRYLPSFVQRYESLIDGDIQVLANVPPQFVEDLESEGIELIDFPSLESSFLMMNPNLVSQNVRDAAWSALSVTYFSELGGGYLMPSGQYAASGIMGYVSNWIPVESELIELNQRVNLTMDIPEGLESLGAVIAEDLSAAGIDLELNSLPLDEFEDKIYSGESELYFFGWKYDLADVSEFLEAVVHSSGEFNGIEYVDLELDRLIEEASYTLDLTERRVLLEEIARSYFDEHVAYPLFEAKVLYGVHPSVHWPLRLDGLILASEIVENVVE